MSNFYEKVRDKGSYQGVRFQWRLWTSRFRKLPDFLIIGVQKGGTTSLYDYLVQHPDIAPASKKEVKYFDIFDGESLDWYRAHFPFRATNKLTGEATPDYVFFPDIAPTVARILPRVKLIVILRNPVERAYSQYLFSVRRGFEDLSFEEALKAEENRLSNTKDVKRSMVYRENSYLLRGCYADQLKVWLSYFPMHQIQILKTEELRHDPRETLSRIVRFLDLPEFEFQTHYQLNKAPDHTPLPEKLRAQLADYYKDLPARLEDMTGISFHWNL